MLDFFDEHQDWRHVQVLTGMQLNALAQRCMETAGLHFDQCTLDVSDTAPTLPCLKMHRLL